MYLTLLTIMLITVVVMLSPIKIHISKGITLEYSWGKFVLLGIEVTTAKDL